MSERRTWSIIAGRGAYMWDNAGMDELLEIFKFNKR